MLWNSEKLLLQVFIFFITSNVSIGTESNHSITSLRRLYGLNYGSKCESLDESFKCMSVCKSIGYRVFRMDFKCRCYCHNIPSTTLLPFFKYVTNSTPMTSRTTRGPRLFEIAQDTQPTPVITVVTTPVPHDSSEENKEDEEATEADEKDEKADNADEAGAKEEKDEKADKPADAADVPADGDAAEAPADGEAPAAEE